MKTLSSHTLNIAHLKPNPQVVHLLPSELAHRYHALPVAIDGERLTVAMAHPEDETACQELMATLDRVNRSGLGSLFFASEGIRKDWAMKRAHLSPRYTTSWQDLPKAH